VFSCVGECGVSFYEVGLAWDGRTVIWGREEVDAMVGVLLGGGDGVGRVEVG